MFLRKIKGNLLFSAEKKKGGGGGGGTPNATSLLYIRDVFCERGPEIVFFVSSLKRRKAKSKKNVAIKNVSK